MKSGNLSLINLGVPSMCFTDHLSLPVGCKTPAKTPEKSSQHVLKHTHDIQAEILLVVPSHIHTHMRAHVGLGTSTVFVSPASFKVEPHRVVAPIYTSGGAAAEGHCPPLILLLHGPHHPLPLYKSYLTVSVINPHVYATKK